MRLTQPFGRKNNVKVIITLLLFSSITLNNSFADKTYAVQNSDFLEKIVRKNYPGSTHSHKKQIMVAILRANPDAFRGGNIHFLKKVDSLTLPDEAVIALIPQDEAARTIKEHYTFFLQKKTGNFPNIPLPKLTNSQKSATENSTVASDSEGVEASQENSNKDSTLSPDSNIDLKTTDASANTNNALELKKSSQSTSNQDPNLATQTKEDRISELERKKKEQDLILQQLDEKIENLENSTPTDADIVETPDNSVGTEQETTTLQETIEAEPDSLPKTAELETKDSAEVDETATSDSSAKANKTSTFIERFLQNKQNLAFLFLPLLGLIGLLFWRRNKQKPTLANDSSKEAIQGKSAAAETAPLGTSSEAEATASTDHDDDAAIKIDMARAYQDMGYSNAAKEILEEVLVEGNNEQKEMAQALLAVF